MPVSNAMCLVHTSTTRAGPDVREAEDAASWKRGLSAEIVLQPVAIACSYLLRNSEVENDVFRQFGEEADLWWRRREIRASGNGVAATEDTHTRRDVWGRREAPTTHVATRLANPLPSNFPHTQTISIGGAVYRLPVKLKWTAFRNPHHPYN
ncbi:hypothetical protein AAG570_000838 [Ranatra chinensis]|uniref:Uncharacterized protein n=1 Tax=Ranatra chinensis TaxID=642074 RepID=A0ABD0YY87_9HEMI